MPAPTSASLSYGDYQRKAKKQPVGLIIVALFHVALGWALVNGLARKIVDVVKAPIEAKIIEAAKPPPEPPPPPPKVKDLPPPPKLPPPPAYVAPPEVKVAAPVVAAPAITTTTVAPPPVETRPAAPPAPVPPPAPVAAPVRTSPQLNFNSCEKPEYTAAARRAEAQGAVLVAFTMDVSGQITEAHVERSSGPTREHKQLDRVTLDAVLACKGRPGSVDGKPEKLAGRVEYVWKID